MVKRVEYLIKYLPTALSSMYSQTLVMQHRPMVPPSYTPGSYITSPTPTMVPTSTVVSNNKRTAEQITPEIINLDDSNYQPKQAKLST